MNLSRSARDYQALKIRITLTSSILELIILGVILATEAARHLENGLQQITSGCYPLVFIGFFFCLALGHEILVFPMAWFRGYRMEKRFGLCSQDFPSWLKDHFKAQALGWGLIFIILIPAYAIMHAFPLHWWWLTALLLWGGYVLLLRLTPMLLLPLFFTFKPLENEDLNSAVKDMAASADLELQGVYEFNMSRKSHAANAAVTGLGASRRIILADTLLRNHPDDEILGVVAHELGHQAHGHLVKIIALNLLILMCFLFAGKAAITRGIAYWGFSGPEDLGAFPLLVLVFCLGGLVFMPLINAMMRSFERQADRFALKATRNPGAFISMLLKLSSQNLAEERPHPLVEFLFYSHPSISRRIEAARDWARRNPNAPEEKDEAPGPGTTNTTP